VCVCGGDFYVVYVMNYSSLMFGGLFVFFLIL
jgi:hypothetical protein